MFEEKESLWRKKGFYIAACVLLVCIMAVGAIGYRKVNLQNNAGNMMANIATEVPNSTADNVGNAAISSDENTEKEETKQANLDLTETFTSQSKNAAKTEKSTKLDKKKAAKSKDKKETTSKSDKKKEKKTVSTTTDKVNHSFDEDKGLLWPVTGDIILKYSMNNAIYFKTLAQYKCNPGIAISAKVGTKVKAAADCKVTKIETTDELGTVVTTSVGDKYKLSYGQLDNLSVNKGDSLKEGDVIGTVAEPTKYYTEEGSNLYFQVMEGKETIDPMLLLR